MIEESIVGGSSLYEAFESAGIVDEITLRVLNSGEVSNALYKSAQEIKKIYQRSLNNKIEILAFMIEPLFLSFTAIFILWLVLGIFLPIWDMGTIIK